MQMEFEPEGDIYNRAFTMELSNACAPFIQRGRPAELASITGLCAPTISFIRNVSNVSQVRVKLDTVLTILPHLEDGPRVFAVCGEYKYDISGMNFKDLLEMLKGRVNVYMAEHGESFTEVERVTGILRPFLSAIRNGGKTKWTVHRALGALEALCGPVYLELYDPASEVRIPRSVDLGKAEDPYDSMVTMLRKASARNMMFMNLCPSEVAKEAEIDLAIMEGFFREIPVPLTLSSILDIAKACKCEINLSVR